MRPGRSRSDLSGSAADSDLAYTRAAELTAAIRHRRSEEKLGFSVPVRVTLSGVDRAAWADVARDVISGNNVTGEPVVSFGDAGLAATIEPVRADG